MKTQDEYNEILKYLSYWCVYLKLDITYSINRLSEYLACALLNTIYNYKLTNLNLVKTNFPAIDLGDNSNDFAFQITSQKDKDKINNTLEKFVINKLHIKYKKGIRFLILDYSFKNKWTKNNFIKYKHFFNPEKHIYTINKLFKDILKLYNTNRKRFNAVKKILKSELELTVINNKRKKVIYESAIELIDRFSIVNTSLPRELRHKEDKDKYINQKIIWGKNKTGKNESLFFNSLVNSTHKHITVIIAPPGGGKSTLLSRFQKYLKENFNKPGTRVITACIIDLGSIKRNEINLIKEQKDWALHYLYEKIELYYNREQVDYYEIKSILNDFFTNSKRKIFLLLDALDEYDRDSLDLLIEKCKILAFSHIKIIITVRKYIWYDIYTKFNKNVMIAEILPVSMDQINDYLENEIILKLPKDVFRKDKQNEFADWVRNPLILNFIYILQGDFKDKTDLYNKVTYLLAESEKEKPSSLLTTDEILSFFEDLALIITQKRIKTIDYNTCKQVFTQNKKLQNKEKYQIKIVKDLFKSAFLRESESSNYTDRRFLHATFLEYFLAKKLYNDFYIILNKKISKVVVKKNLSLIIDEIKELDLAKAQIDYVSEIICGFILQMLSTKIKIEINNIPFVILKKLNEFGKFFKKCYNYGILPNDDPMETKTSPRFWELFRNLVEFTGYTFYDEKNQKKICDELLTIIENKQYSELVQYNAARALARVHASAPRPHFDYHSDWSGKKYEEKYTFCECIRWLIAGGGRQERIPVRTSGLLINLNKNYNQTLQEIVSNRLIKSLSDPEILKRKYFAINCSCALISWYFENNKYRRKLSDNILKAKNIRVRIVKKLKNDKNEKVYIPLSVIIKNNLNSAKKIWNKLHNDA